jgi:peptide/nickel transport system substrate-binding protein
MERATRIGDPAREWRSVWPASPSGATASSRSQRSVVIDSAYRIPPPLAGEGREGEVAKGFQRRNDGVCGNHPPPAPPPQAGEESTRVLLSIRAILLLALLLLALPAAAAPFRWANDGDVASMDPYARNETFLLSVLGNVYEPLLRRDATLKLEPALAIAWSQPAPDIWRFELRPNVRFHDGTPLTADDVVFSVTRARQPGSRMNSKLARIREVRAVGPLAVEFTTDGPDLILAEEISDWFIMSRVWAEKNGAAEPADISKNQEGYASRNTNGTGPFMLKERIPDVRTVLVPNPSWWDEKRHNLDEVTLLRIANDATRVAALVSGEVDMVYTVPPNDVQRLKETPGLKIYETPELRVVFFGFDLMSDRLPDSDVADRNPFKDIRVRRALFQAIDIEAIRAKVMRGSAAPVGNLVARGVNGYDVEADERLPYDPAAAKLLLAEAGYPKGFRFTMDCPNDRYVNDAAICQAVAAMFARIGVAVELNAQTRNRHFGKVLRKESSFYMLGWTPTTYDAHNVILNVMITPDDKDQGTNNIRGYSNARVDALGRLIGIELDPERRAAMIREALLLHRDEIGHLPLHQQTVVWAARSNIELIQLGDNVFPLRHVRVK